jgi:hypothetical protein
MHNEIELNSSNSLTPQEIGRHFWDSLYVIEDTTWLLQKLFYYKNIFKQKRIILSVNFD